MRPIEVPDTGKIILIIIIIKDYYVTCFGLIQRRIYQDGQIMKEEYLTFSVPMLSVTS
jgi:hypothetical protein